MITTFNIPTKLIFGPGSVAQLGDEAKKLGRKAILVTGTKSMRKTGVIDTVTSILKAKDVDVTIFDKVEPNPHVTTIDEGAKIIRTNKIDLVIGLGGGSTMDAAKGMTLASTGAASVWDYVEGKAEAKSSVPSLILVPTVAASGSEVNNGAVISNWETHEKRALFNPYIFSKVSIVDPELTLTMPAKATAQGGLDIFCHVVENYITTNEPSPLSGAIREAVMREVIELLPQLLTKLDNIKLRTRISWASTIACSQFIELGGGGGAKTLHGISHAFGAHYDTTHANSLAALLIAWMRFTYPVRKERFASLGRNVFGEPDGIAATDKWVEKIGMKMRLRDLGAQPERFDEMASWAVKSAPWVKNHPREMDTKAVAQIYRDSY